MHLELQATSRGVRAYDLDSSNGTSVDGVAIGVAYLTSARELKVGAQRLRFLPEPARDVAIEGPRRFGGLVSATPEMIELFAKLQRYAPHDIPILIQGETGTGKDRVAQAIHEASPRRDKDLIAVNCAVGADSLLDDDLFGHVKGAFTGADRAHDGLFVQADGSTLFFATHVDLRRAVSQGRFREDLYYRIAEVTVEIPPLRRRLEDLPVLVDAILTDFKRTDLIVDVAALSALLAQPWHGNVRQLRGVIRRAVIESDGPRLMVERVLAACAPAQEPVDATVPYEVALQEFHRHYYTPLHKRFGGNLTKIHEASGRHRATVRTDLRALGLLP
jgi:DNA-binding NtrC family response regulator